MAEEHRLRKHLFLLLALIGLVVASISGLSQRLEWRAALCTGFTQGCQETAEFSLFGVPVWLWGVTYYILISLLVFRAYGLLFWFLAAGFGFELGFMWTMFSLNTVCVFCLANFAVMAALTLCSLERASLWQTLSVTFATLLLALVLIPYGSGRPLAATGKQDPALAARVGGTVITYDELVQPLASRIAELEQQIYRLERERLDQLVAKMLLDREAEHQGKQTQDLVKEFLASQIVAADDREVEDYYVENRSRWAEWKGSEQELKAQIRAYLQQVKAQQKVLEYAKSLSSRHGVEIYLKEPQPRSIQVSLEKDDPVMGPENALLTIVEFSDYQCPACRRNHEVVRELRTMYKDRVKWVFKDFPMPGHKWAKGAAIAAHCAAEQGEFWRYQDLLFGSQEELSSDRLTELAKQLGLQMEPFSQCLQAGKFQNHIDKDIEQGRKFGFNTTPTFVINNRVVAGAPPPDRFRQIIDEELEKVRKSS
jgi:protein-disulfide isomerase